MVWWLQDSSRASKAVLVQVLWHQGQQTYVGAHGIQRRSFGYAKIRFWIPLPGIQRRFFGDAKIRFCFLYAPAQALWHQGHQTCAGAHGIQSRCFGKGKTRFWVPGQTLNDLQSSVLLSAIATSDMRTLTSADRTSDWRLIGHLMIGNLVFAAWWPQGAGGYYHIITFKYYNVRML